MPRQFLRRVLPDHQTVRRYRVIAAFGPLLDHPNLWHLNRRSVAGGVAVGLFAGLIPGPLQMLGAALLAVPLRVNLPVALFCTLYTNPFTIVPLYLLAYQLGELVTGEEGAMSDPPDFSWAGMATWSGVSSYAQALGEWALSLGQPLLVGLVTLALLLAGLGWIVMRSIWRIHVVRAWRRRARLRSERSAR
jgi:uncharacterized protein (DUF2062 family)